MTNQKIRDFKIPRQWLDAEYALQPREVESIENVVYNVVRNKAVLQKWFPTKQIPQGMRTHEIKIALELDPPIYDGNFMVEDLDEVRTTPITHTLQPMHKDFQINMIDYHASQNQRYYSTRIDELNLREAVKTVADYKERLLYRGMDHLNRARDGANPQGIIDTTVYSLINPPTLPDSQNSFSAAGDNAGMNSAGDGPLSVGAAMASLVPYLYFGPYVFQMTPDIYGQLVQNFNSTTHISDLERMKAMTDLGGNRILEGLDCTHYLIKAAAQADNGSMLMFQRKTQDGEPTGVILESYPITHVPTQESRLGIKGKVFWMGCFATIRAAGFTLETSVDLIA